VNFPQPLCTAGEEIRDSRWRSLPYFGFKSVSMQLVESGQSVRLRSVGQISVQIGQV
jgi:hypothetical protein